MHYDVRVFRTGNSVTADSELASQSLQAVLKEDAVYRIRFAMPQSVGVIEEEDESGEQRGEDAIVTRVFTEGVQFLERQVFADEDSCSGHGEHML
ncbi:unnamed protein product [Haemonchus placei]|uniref:I-set domain-containing protein n=1 Tax=Haemonchus placei TaxID=6290 RepID=A0A0N4WF24_HAEPC|nr:unnamed protein product [Haemonchus placei]